MKKITILLAFVFCVAFQAAAAEYVVMETNCGVIKIELYDDKAPVSVANFLKYVDKGTYEGTIFHRVIKGFMIQGGGFLENRRKVETLPPIKNEANNGLKNLRGTIAMARTNVVDSATNQFFINLVDNAFLDFRSPDQRGYGYAVFGKVVEGMDVVDKIGSTPTQRVNAVFADMPVKPVIIGKVKRVE